MAVFVLVHGAWHGSWCWKRVRRLLSEKGQEVFTPTLTGVGERSHLASREVNLETHIMDVVNLIRWEELADVVLCGHSYGGCVVTGAADRVADRIRALVYLDAFVLQDGEYLYQHVPAGQQAGMLEGWKVPPIPAEVFKVNAADRDWVDRQCTVQPVETFRQPLELTGAVNRIKNVRFILASGFTAGSPFPPFYEQARANGWETRTIACGHDVMLDRPEELTALLIEAAGESQRAQGG
jgi:pimeloyl-ACP methyl ester carboxylesterase